MFKKTALLACGLALLGGSAQSHSPYAEKFNKWAGSIGIKTHQTKDKKTRPTNSMGAACADDLIRILQIWTLDSKNPHYIQMVNGLSAVVKASQVYQDFFKKNANDGAGHYSFLVFEGTDPSKTKKDSAKKDKQETPGDACGALVSAAQLANIGEHVLDALSIGSDVQVAREAKKLATLNMQTPQSKKIVMTALGLLGGPVASFIAIPSMQSKSSKHKNWAVMTAGLGMFLKGLQRYMIWQEQQTRLKLIAEANNNNEGVIGIG